MPPPRPKIIAEVGSNWETFDHCMASVAAAKAAKADAVKFQAFTREALYGWRRDPPGTYELKLAWLPELKAKADALGIDFMVTAFSPELLKAVDPYVETHKIASSDLNYPHLLQAVKDTGKEVFLSTGGQTRESIELALKYLDPKKTTLLYCVPAYPARTTDLHRLDELKTFDTKAVGFSDHSTDILGLPVLASELFGAKVLEKHMTAFPTLETPDRPHSLSPFEFKTMVEAIMGYPKSPLGSSLEELPMVERHRRRLVATSALAKGDRLKFGYNFGAYRSLKPERLGLSPFVWPSVEGTRASRAIGQGEAIGVGDFE